MANTKITPHVLDSTLISGHSTVTAATNDFVLIQDVSDSNALKKALVSDLAQNEESPTFTGNVSVGGTLSVTGAVTLGDYIEKTSGNLTIDVAGDIILDADGGAHYFKDGGTTLMHLSPHALGVGVSPEGAYNGYTSIEFGQQGAIFANDAADDFGLKVNTYLDSGGNWKRKETGVASSIDMDGDQIKFFTAASGSADANITFAQKLRIDNDGIKFGSDTAAANALDDYEEGNWTVAVISSAGSGTYTLSNEYGWYVKIGNVVHAGASFDLSTSSATGNMQISGLPFACSANGTRPLFTGQVGYTINVVPQPGYVTMGNGSAESYVDVWKEGNNSRYALSDWDNGGRMNFQITYEQA